MSVDFDFRKKDPYLRRRYGIKEERFPKWLRTAIIFLVMAIAWTLWSGLNRAHPEVRYDLISFKPIDQKNIEIHGLGYKAALSGKTIQRSLRKSRS